MARLLKAGASSSTGSLSTGAPAGIVTPARPPNVSVRSVPGMMDAPLPASWRAMCAEPTTSGVRPNSLDRRTRMREPPTLMWTIWRSVWLSNWAGVARMMGGSGACGLAVQVPTQRGPRRPSWSSSSPLARLASGSERAPASSRLRPTKVRRRHCVAWAAVVLGSIRLMASPGCCWPDGPCRPAAREHSATNTPPLASHAHASTSQGLPAALTADSHLAGCFDQNHLGPAVRQRATIGSFRLFNDEQLRPLVVNLAVRAVCELSLN